VALTMDNAGGAGLLATRPLPNITAVEALRDFRPLSSWPCPQNCSGHGSCSAASGECTCFTGFSGPGCEVEAKLRCPSDCSQHGWCVKGSICLCEEYWRGTACDVPAQCPNGCSGFGQCVRNKCFCDKLHKGDDCSTPRPSCPGWPAVCGGEDRGICTGTGFCKCRTGFGGHACELLAEEISCPVGYNETGVRIGSICSGHGECWNADGMAKGRCECSTGWAGDACERPSNRIPLGTLLLLIGLSMSFLMLGIGGTLAYCVLVRGLLLRELLRGRWKRITKEDGWRRCDADGQIEGARFERYFGDITDFAAESTAAEKRRSAMGGPR